MSKIDLSQLNTIMDELKEPPKKRIHGFAKKLTYAIIIITFIFGIIGNFDFIPFNMEGFVSFIPMFASLFIPLVLSIGINSAMEKHEKTSLEKEIIKKG